MFIPVAFVPVWAVRRVGAGVPRPWAESWVDPPPGMGGRLLALKAVAMGLGMAAGWATAAQADDSAWKKWMKDNIVPAKVAGDFKKLEDLLAKIAAANPDPAAMPKWKQYSDDGLAAAQKADKDALNKSCAACHNDYRKIFKEKYRNAPLPK